MSEHVQNRFIPMRKPRRTISIRSLWLMTGVVFVAALPRILSLYLQLIDHDEVWSIYQSIGTPQQIFDWLPYDWQPLHYQVLGVWERLVGIHPVAVRMSSVLISILGVPLVYRVVRRVSGNNNAGLMAALFYAVLPFNVLTGIVVRGYVLLVTLISLSLWFTIRYFHRPTVWRGILLGLCMVSMFYTHLTAVFAFAMLGLYTLLQAPKQIWRWWLPALVAFPLAIPELLSKVQLTVNRVGTLQQVQQVPPFAALAALFNDLVIGNVLPWLVLALCALIALVALWFRAKPQMRRVIIFFGVWSLLPVPLYLTNGLHGFFNVRYMSFFLIGLCAVFGIGLGSLPRWGTRLAALTLVISALFIAPGNAAYLSDQYPFDMVFSSLKREMRPGDVLLIDANLPTSRPEEWEYFTRVYFPEGLMVVNTPGDHRRIWYAAADGFNHEPTHAAILDQRLPSTYFGPWNFLVRLYEGAPDQQGIDYANGLRFHGMDITNATTSSYAVFREGEALRLRQWWSVDAPVQQDYSLGVYILDHANTLVTEYNGGLSAVEGSSPTSQWRPNEYYIVEFELMLPNPMPTAWYPVQQAVYQWWDGVRIGVETGNEQNLLDVARIHIKSW